MNNFGKPRTAFCDRYVGHTDRGCCVYCRPLLCSVPLRVLEFRRREKHLRGPDLDAIVIALRLNE